MARVPVICYCPCFICSPLTCPHVKNQDKTGFAFTRFVTQVSWLTASEVSFGNKELIPSLQQLMRSDCKSTNQS